MCQENMSWVQIMLPDHAVMHRAKIVRGAMRDLMKSTDHPLAVPSGSGPLVRSHAWKFKWNANSGRFKRSQLGDEFVLFMHSTRNRVRNESCALRQRCNLSGDHGGDLGELWPETHLAAKIAESSITQRMQPLRRQKILFANCWFSTS